jgi:deoxyribodipyrimidine photolyase
MGRPFQERLANVRWEVSEDHLAAWKRGKTGIPIVDAAMRQMNTMGNYAWMLTLGTVPNVFLRLDA